MKNIRFFLSENFPFLIVKCLIYLNRRVFVMCLNITETSIFVFSMCSLLPGTIFTDLIIYKN